MAFTGLLYLQIYYGLLSRKYLPRTQEKLELEYGFYRIALLADLLWLVVERAFTKNSRKLFGENCLKNCLENCLENCSENCLEHNCE